MNVDIITKYEKLMNDYSYVNIDSNSDLMNDGYYHQLSAPGFNEMGSADIRAQML